MTDDFDPVAEQLAPAPAPPSGTDSGLIPAEQYLTGRMLRGLPDHLMDLVVANLVRSADAARLLRLEHVHLADSYFEQLAEGDAMAESLSALCMERDRLVHETTAQSHHIRALHIELARMQAECDQAGDALSLLGLAVGLLQQIPAAQDNPEVVAFFAQAAQLGVGRRVPVRTGHLGPATNGGQGATILPFPARHPATPDT